MKWNVYIYNINRQKMEIYNIFNHFSFYQEVEEILKKDLTREEIHQRIISPLRYYFWSKAEWEIVLRPWIGKDDVAEKIDVYDQVMLNYEAFIDYLLKCKEKGMVEMPNEGRVVF